MKHPLLSISIAVLTACCGLSAQQVDLYEFSSQTTGSYEPFSDGILLQKSAEVKGERFKSMIFNLDDSLYFEGNAALKGIEIGFDFPYAGEMYDRFVAVGMGYVVLGKGETVSLDGAAYTLPLELGPRMGIGTRETVYGLDNTSISYKVEGNAPERVLVVQFSNIGYTPDAAGDARFNYQIRLHETDGDIEMCFDGFQIPETCGSTNSWAIGLTDKNGNDHFRQPEESSWSSTSKTTSMLAARFVNGSVFEEGLEFVFSRPPVCEMPTETIADIVLDTYSDRIGVQEEVDTNGHAETYLVVKSDEPVQGSPDGAEYQVGESLLGGEVLAVGELASFRPISFTEDGKRLLSFTHEGLQPNTSYHYAVYLGNTQCTSPKYTPAKTASATTSTSAAGGIEIVSLNWKQVSFNIEANTLGEEILIAMTNQKSTAQGHNGRYYIGSFGRVEAEAVAGDTLKMEDGSFGGVVLYTGSAGNGITCPVELENNEIYYFGAFSKGANGLYSTLCVQDYGLTDARIPFDAKFENMAAFENEPFLGGWAGTKGFSVGDGTGTVTAIMPAMEEGGVYEALLCLPPMDFPMDSNVLLKMDYSLNPWDLDLVEGDSIVVETSIDEGQTYRIADALSMHSNSRSELSNVVLKGLYGEKQLRIRIRVVSRNPEAMNWTFSNLSVTGIALCDIPKSLRASTSVVGGNVPVSWDPSLNEESEWQFSYAGPEGDAYGDWSTPVSVRTRPYWLSGLGDNQTYKVRVRAVCGVGQTSPWVETEVLSGRVPTFTEDFNNLTPGTSEWYDPFDLPSYWSCDNSMYEGVEDTMSYAPYSSDVEAYDWKTANEPVPGQSNAAVAYHFNNLAYGVEMLVSPTIELIPADGSFLTFDVAYGSIDEQGAYEALTEAQPGHRLELWVSVDSGRSFVTTQPLRVWDSTQLLTLQGTQPVSVDLEGYQGGVAFAFAFFGHSGGESNPIVWIDNFGITNNCPVARSLKVRELDASSALVEWVADKTVEEWILKLESAAGTEMYVTAEDSYRFTDLEPETTYGFSVGHLCGTDTSAWASLEFTTGGRECAEPENVATGEITRNSALLSWEGEAARYRIRIRPVTEDGAEWAFYEAEGNTYRLENLQTETAYEGGIQALCGQASGDTSAYVPFPDFTTLELTCFAPGSLRTIGTVAHDQAMVSWIGEAGSFQVEWDIRYEDDKPESKLVDKDTCVLDGLQADTWYQFRVRGICSPGDTSDWSEYRNFETPSTPPCPAPFDLQVESVTENSALLSWKIEEPVNGFLLRHRASTEYSWDTLFDLDETRYELTGLRPSTAYLWAVLTACSDGRYSGWASQNRFETEGVSNEEIAGNGLSVTASKGQIHVMNPHALKLERIRLYGLTGKMLQEYVLNSNHNAILTTGISMQVIVVEILAESRSFRFKILVP